MSSKRNQADPLFLWPLPLTVKPWTGNHEIGVLRVMLFRVSENLPGSPRIFLIPKSRDIQVRNRRSVKLPHPGFFLPEAVVVRVINRGVPIRNLAVKIFLVDIRERA